MTCHNTDQWHLGFDPASSLAGQPLYWPLLDLLSYLVSGAQCLANVFLCIKITENLIDTNIYVESISDYRFGQ